MLGLSHWSLARRQLAILISSLTLAAGLLGIGGALYINGYTERSADRVLGASAHSIGETIALERGTIKLDVPVSAFEMVEDSGRDNIYYSVTVGGRLITGYQDFPAPRPQDITGDELSFRYGQYLGQPVRIALQARRLPRLREPVIVQVAETLNERKQESASMLMGLAALEIVLIVIAALLIRPAVRWGLAPLTRLHAEMAAREGGQLGYAPLGTEEVPNELRPLVLAFNKLLARLQGAAELVRRFTADASHQMRTPLATLKTHMSLVRLYDPATPQGRTALDEVDAAIERLERLLSQLIGLARAEEGSAGTSPDRLATVDLAEVAAETAREFVPLSVAEGIDIHFENAAPAHARCDPLIVSEILANLIDNAIRYNRPGGSVVVRTVVVEDMAGIEVEDDGPGIPEEQRAAVFGRFFRLDRDRAMRGSGLGLPIVRSLALACGADISLDAGRDGCGLLVRLLFSAARD